VDEAALRELVGRLNWIDWIVVLVVLMAVLGGLRDGFVVGTLQLAGSVLAVIAAVVGLPRAEAAIGDHVSLPKAETSVLAFLALLLVVRAACVIVGMGLRPRGLGRRGRGAAALSSLAGLVPGAAHGVIIATVAVVPFVAVPILPEATQAIQQSALASRLIDAVAQRAPAGTLALGLKRSRSS